jgi:hypothetical protein
MENFKSLIEAIEQYRKEGYKEDFNLEQHCLQCKNEKYETFYDDFVIDKFYRFDAMTDPDEESIIYAISSEKYKLKGILINGYGVSSRIEASTILLKLLSNNNSAINKNKYIH